MSHLLGLDPDRLISLSSNDFRHQHLDPKEIEAIFRACNAFWMHNGDPVMPHVKLTSGLCSNGYINCREVLCRSNLCQIMANQLVYMLTRKWRQKIDWVIGSDSAALGLSKDVANNIGAKWHPMQKGPNKTQIWEGMVIPEGETVVHVEELMTTALTARMVRSGIKLAHPYPITFVPVLPVLIHRPAEEGCNEIDDSEVTALCHYQIWAKEQKECPLCQAGSEAITPKGENWARLQSNV